MYFSFFSSHLLCFPVSALVASSFPLFILLTLQLNLAIYTFPAMLTVDALALEAPRYK